MEEFEEIIFELNNKISKQIEYLEEKIVIFNGHNVKYHEFTILNFISKFKSNLKGLKILLNCFSNDEFLLIPINSVMRSVSSDGLTLSYLMSFLSNDLNDKQVTFLNELKSISTEHFYLLKEFNSNYIDQEFLDGKSKIKNRIQFHVNSDENIIGDVKILSLNTFLSEKKKLERVNYSFDEKKGIFGLDDIQKFDIKTHIKTCYETNKFFSQYYHYNHLNSKFITSKKNDQVLSEIRQISCCIKSSFLILYFFSEYLFKVN